jgi:hypothetical protein
VFLLSIDFKTMGLSLPQAALNHANANAHGIAYWLPSVGPLGKRRNAESRKQQRHSRGRLCHKKKKKQQQRRRVRTDATHAVKMTATRFNGNRLDFQTRARYEVV